MRRLTMAPGIVACLFAAALLMTTALQGCSTPVGKAVGATPEAQIAAGANAVTAASTLATVLLKNDRITVTQAKSYSGLLHAAGGHLDSADQALQGCRSRTSSTAKTAPDPCAATVADDVALGLSVVNDVQKVLDARK